MPAEKQTLNSLNTSDFQHINSLVAVDNAASKGRGGISVGGFLLPLLPYKNSVFEKAEQLEKELKKKLLHRFLDDKRRYLYKVENKQNIYVSPDFSLDDFDSEFLLEQAALRLRERIQFDKEGHYKSAVCNDCGIVLKKRAVALHSFSRYSSEEGNVKALISKNKKKLKTILRKIQRVKEFVISFPTHPAYFKSLSSGYRNVINLFFEELRKTGIDFPSLQVIDFAVSVDKTRKIWQVHFHFLAPNIEQENFDVRRWFPVRDKVAEKTSTYFTISFGKYKKKRRAIGYFALMMSGRYTFGGEHHGAGLDEIIDEKEYLLNFFGMRSYSIREHRNNRLMDFDNKYFDWLCSIQCLSIPQECPFCHSTNIILLTPQQLEVFKPPNPDLFVKSLAKEQNFTNDNSQKRFGRWCDLQEGKKIKKSDLDLTDTLNLIAFGKC